MKRRRLHIMKKKENPLKADEVINKRRFEIKKVKDVVYSEKTNYYIEYWKMYYENEYILAKIKENAYEINTMKMHIDELNNQNKS